MGQILHGSAATTHAVRAALQRSTASTAELSRTHRLNPKTVAKRRCRAGVDDAPMGPKEHRSTVRSREEEVLALAFRRYTLLPLDDCLFALQATIPHLTHSSLHACLSATASAGCQTSRDQGRSRNSRHVRLATSTSTSPRFGPKRASSTCSLPLIAPASLPLPNCMRGSAGATPETFSAA